MQTKYYLAACCSLLLVVALIAFPNISFSASSAGLNLWWKAVIPALLPFLVAVELLSGLGAIHYLGTLLDPLMQSLFKVPGVGGFILAASLASGFPMGAMLISRYRQASALSKEEGERLVAFAHTAGPLFLLGSVSVGMLAWPQIGPTLALSQYLSCLFLGLLMRWHKRDAKPSLSAQPRVHIFTQAAKALITARKEDGRSIAKVLNDAIVKSSGTLLMLGGYIVTFSVLGELLTIALIPNLARILSLNAKNLSLFCAGVMEVTTGCDRIAHSMLCMNRKIIAISATIGWSGLSVQGQAIGFLNKTDISLKPFYIARGLHACLAALFSTLLLRINWLPLSIFTMKIPDSQKGQGALILQGFLNLGQMITALLLITFILVIIRKLKQLKVVFFRVSQRRN